MNLTRYIPLTDHKHEKYEFLSSGNKGTIRKVVLYQHLEDDIFNLAFGDWDEESQTISDTARSNNNDQEMVLATVAATVVESLEFHPGAIVLAQGSTEARTRLYQTGINKYLAEISVQFDIQGFIDGTWQLIQPGKNYQAFALTGK